MSNNISRPFYIGLILFLLFTMTTWGGLFDPPLSNPSFEDNPINPGVWIYEFDSWYDVDGWIEYATGSSGNGIPFTPYGYIWTGFVGNAGTSQTGLIYQQAGTWSPNLSCEVTFLFGKRSGRTPFPMRISLWAGGNPSTAADDVSLVTVGATMIDSVTVTPDFGGEEIATLETRVLLNTGTGYSETDPLWLEFKSLGTIDSQLFVDNIQIKAAVLASTPNPANGETGVQPGINLNWTEPTVFGSTFKLYFGTNPDIISNPEFTDIHPPFTPSALDYMTTYYWRVDTVTDTETFEGDVWSFTTGGKANRPSPADNQVNVRIGSVDLNWTKDSWADSCKVYAGTKLPLTYLGEVTGIVFSDFPANSEKTTYYWRVDEYANGQLAMQGDIWSFTTRGSLAICPEGDINNDCTVGMEDIFLMAQQWLDPYGCDGFAQTCADLVGQDGVNLSDMAVLSSNWQRQGESIIVINEIQYNPDVKTELVEFIELYNTGPFDVDISGWRFCDGVDYTFPEGTILQADSYLVIAEDPSAAYSPVTISQKYGTDSSLVMGPFMGSLSNEGEQITLCDAFGSEIDQVDYRLGFPWPTAGDPIPDDGTHLGSGHSIQLIYPHFDNDLAGSWRSAYPTPGDMNVGVFAENCPPQIRQVDHSPQQPKSGQIVTITAKVTDPDQVASVVLQYQVVNPGSYIPITLPNLSTATPNVPNPDYENTANWMTLVMLDNGQNGDISAGDNIYTVQLPANIQSHRRLIRYRITVEDGEGLSIRVPYADDPQPNFAYYVYDGVPSWTGDGVTYSSEVLSSLPVYQLISRSTDIEACFWNSAWNDGKYHFVGTFVYDGKVYDHVYYHIRGQASTYRWGKNKCKFNFSRGHYFQACDDYGVEYENKWNNIVLGTGTCPWWKWQHPDGDWDQGAGGMVLNEPLGYRLYNLAGITSPNTNYFHFRVIDAAAEAGSTQYDGDFWGLYFAIEEPDSRFIKEHDLADGNLYKMEVGSADQKNQGVTQVTNASDVWAFIDGQNSSSTQDWWEANVNLDSYYSYRTVGIVVNDSDRRSQENCLYFHDPMTAKWTIHPWDLDLSFEWGGHYSPTIWESIQHCLNYSVLNLAYQNRARELEDLLFDNNHGGWRQTDQLVDEMASVIASDFNGQRFIDAEQAVWDNHPRVSGMYRNLWYQHNEFFTQPGNSANWDFMAAYYKQYLTAAGMSSFLSGSYGLHALNASIADTQIPNTPIITYLGVVNSDGSYPENNLRFETSAFSDPQGAGTFGAIQWRIARVDDPAADGYLVRQRHHYEVETKWQSQDITNAGQLTVQIPADEVEVGGMYRVRCRMKDNTGRCSHWSAPIQFIAAGGIVTDLLENLRLTEMMYNPVAPDAAEIAAGYTDNDAFEFIELQNTGLTPLDLTDTYFSDGIEYSFGRWTQSETPLIDTGFNSGTDGFIYTDDSFGTSNPNYASGSYEASGGYSGGGLGVYLGTATSRPMSGGWSGTFTLAQSSIVTISVNYRMIAGTGLDRDEYGQAILQIDGTWHGDSTNKSLVYITGNGNAGSDDDSGWQTYQTTIGLSAGMHTIILGGYCNKANSSGNEWIRVYFDNVALTAMVTASVPYTLEPGAHVLVVKNQAAFEARYGAALSSRIAGQYSGSLNNAGETIRLTDAWDGNIFKFTYNDGYGWPVPADGLGHSLVPVDSAIAGQREGSMDYGGNWRASTYR
ncbi:MAG: lamin tail domain-containing protein, partial [Sedimentisphaerales bacterium]|nr:lamin tail domain-containing protein [Sedimentisphaerales bacterium]